jgi:4-hydroxy-tetrahydrodipicolinate synthase
MNKPHIISALGTPLTESESLHVEGLAAHLSDQWDNGIGGVLVAGTMGLMQLLSDQTYQDLVRRSVELSTGRGEVMIGAGDCSFARSKARIDYLNEFKIDGVVVLTPYFVRFSQAELISYYRALADASRAPLYLYDLPQRTGCKIELATALDLAKHPNIRGIKCSDEPGYAREVMDAAGPQFRVVIAQPVLMDVFLRAGVMEHLDGMYAIAPQWAAGVAREAQRENWDAAADYQRRLNRLRSLIAAYGAFQTMTAVLNARGIPGNFAPRPYRSLDAAQQAALMSDPTVKLLLSESAR